jgi:hypothetical protein
MIPLDIYEKFRDTRIMKKYQLRIAYKLKSDRSAGFRIGGGDYVSETERKIALDKFVKDNPTAKLLHVALAEI